MTRVFSVTIPADTNYHNLFSLLVGTAVYGAANGGTNETAITGAIPTDGILPDRCTQLIFGGTATTGILISDRNNANSAGYPLVNNVQTIMGTPGVNAICLKDLFVKGSGLSFDIVIVYV
jgi:hypothetical protein